MSRQRLHYDQDDDQKILYQQFQQFLIKYTGSSSNLLVYRDEFQNNLPQKYILEYGATDVIQFIEFISNQGNVHYSRWFQNRNGEGKKLDDILRKFHPTRFALYENCDLMVSINSDKQKLKEDRRSHDNDFLRIEVNNLKVLLKLSPIDYIHCEQIFGMLLERAQRINRTKSSDQTGEYKPLPIPRDCDVSNFEFLQEILKTNCHQLGNLWIEAHCTLIVSYKKNSNLKKNVTELTKEEREKFKRESILNRGGPAFCLFVMSKMYACAQRLIDLNLIWITPENYRAYCHSLSYCNREMASFIRKKNIRILSSISSSFT